ncbi:MAG: putative lipid II flippase FtsW [Jatrophihabitans sp.]
MTSIRSALGQRVGEVREAEDGLRGAVRRFLAKPYASVQLMVLATVGLLGFGLLMAVSTTIAAARDNGGTGSIWNQAVKEILFIVVGLVIFWAAVRLSPRGFRVLAYPMIGIALISLVAVLIPGIGVGVYGARRWIEIGPLQLQPSEFAKLAMLLWAADLLARKQQLGTLKRARHLFVPLLPGFGLVTLLVMLEPDLGTTLCFMLILLGVLWMVGMPMRYFVGLVGLVGLAVTALAVTEPYRLERLTTFVNPFKDTQTTGYHTVEGLYALASGGVFGVGLGQGTSKYGWVPNANSDYVFAIIGEELGLIGCLAVLVLFGLFAYSGMRIVRRSADPFVRVAAGGATIWLCGQAVINIGYVTGLLPVTGIPLPLISAGGTSLLITFFVIGMLVSFARHESAAVTAARRADRRNCRTRLERWCRIPVPIAYVAPKKRRKVATTATTPRDELRRRASTASPRATMTSTQRPTGPARAERVVRTDGRTRRIS